MRHVPRVVTLGNVSGDVAPLVDEDSVEEARQTTKETRESLKEAR